MLALLATGCTKSALREFSLFRPGIASKENERSRREIAQEVTDALQGKGSTMLTIWHDSFAEAQAAAAESGKPILADFTGGAWCPWCVKLEEDVFDKDEFKQWAREKVTLLELNYPSNAAAASIQNVELAKRYGVSGYPTVLLLTPEGKVLGKLGYDADATNWIRSANAILDN